VRYIFEGLGKNPHWTPWKPNEKDWNMRIAVMGVGDYGSRFAAWLINSGQDVTLIARGNTLERLRTEGLTATKGTITPEMHIDHVNATDDPASVGPVDLVLMCVKLYQLDNAMEVASPLVGINTTVMGFQNGVTAEDRLVKRFGAERVVGVGASAGQVPLAIGELPKGKSLRTTEIVKIFKEAGGVNVVEHENVMEAIWGKFIVVSGASVCALSRQSVGEVAKVPELRQLASMAVSEAIELANAKGLSFGQNYIQKADSLWDEIAESNPAWRPSLLQDLDAGRPLELDAWSGGTVTIGKGLGIPTPANFAIYAGLKPYENGRL
jgi:2-dehydropantoate 2-reductase